MDKSWINELRSSRTYLDGVASFIKFACENGLIGGKIFCPCKRCYNKHCLDPEVVEEHLLWNGFSRGYTTWVFHGESVPQPQSIASETHAESLEQSPLGTYLHPHGFTNSNTTRVEEGITRQEELRQLVRDACGVHESNLNEEPSGDATILEPTFEADNNDTDQFRKLMEGCDEPLFPGCRKHSKVSFLVTLYHLKISHSWSGKSFTELLEILAEIFPEGTAFPSSYYDAKKLLKALDLSYEKIHACPNDCMLFQDDEHSEVCKICGSSRWASNEDEDNGVITNMNVTPTNMDTTTKKRKPAKVLRYFPLIPRLKRLYMSSKTASSMSWHQHGRIKDGKLRHPADALAWKKFDERYHDFAADPRNIRLGLASDGFNPYRTMSTTYSTWPVLLIPYNLEPWVCMKRSSIMLSMIIPGEKGPGNDIDVFLQPLIAELIQLWKGVEAFDTSTGQNFNLRAALMWTVNDFPAYANLSGWSTKGRYACPSCADSTHSQWLFHGGKFCYMGHRRWLDSNHEFRHQKDHFDGTLELRPPPIPPSGPEVFAQVERLNHIYGKPNKLSKKRGRDQGSTVANAYVGAESNIARQGTMNISSKKKCLMS